MGHEPWLSKKTTILSPRLDVGKNSEDREQLRMRLATLTSLGLNRQHKDEGGEDSGRHSRRAQTPRRTRNQEVEDAVVQCPRRHKTQQWSQEVHQTHEYTPPFANHLLVAQGRRRRPGERLSSGHQRGSVTRVSLKPLALIISQIRAPAF